MSIYNHKWTFIQIVKVFVRILCVYYRALTINDPSATSVWISNLFGYIEYNISVAINNKYNGTFNEGMTVYTEEGSKFFYML